MGLAAACRWMDAAPPLRPPDAGRPAIPGRHAREKKKPQAVLPCIARGDLDRGCRGPGCRLGGKGGCTRAGADHPWFRHEAPRGIGRFNAYAGDGGAFVFVYAPEDADAENAKTVFAAHPPVFARRYLRVAIEQLVLNPKAP